MNKAYNRTYWENYPSDASPINEASLNKIEVGVDEIDNRVITLDATKFDKTEASKLIKSITFDRVTGVFTITYYNGAKATIDTMLEKLAINFDYDIQTQRLIITLDDGTLKYVDMSALITQYEFLESGTVAFSVNSSGEVSAIVKEGSIEEKHLQPNYLADIKVEVAKAQASQTAAATSEANALESENAAKTSETNAKTSEINAKVSETNAASSAGTASAQATAAKNSATAAATSATNAATSAYTASNKATEAANSAASAASSAGTATSKASAASTSAANAADSATEAESYAHGGTGTRENEDSDNAKYYYEQAKGISEGLQGSLLPMGTITFSQLETSTKQSGYMYNISDEFTTDDTFKEGAGYTYPAGTNVYYTADGYWDCLAGTQVTGVKGNAETSYRKGNVNITPENIGALSKESEETRKLNGNISQYSSRTEFNSLGWYRVAKYSPNHQNAYQGASSNGCDIILKRSWGNQKGEYHHIELMWTSERTAKFKPVSDISQYSGITAIRLVGDSSSQTAYIDIYYACSQLNAVNIIITNGSTATGYNWEVIAPIQVPESADGITEYASGAIRANSLGCATYDGEGRDIAVNYLKKGDDSANNIVTFTTGDVASPTAWTDVSVLSSGEKHSSILNKISTMFKNVRYTYNTLSGFLSTLKYTNISSYVNYNSSEISSINAWCESGMVVLYVTIKAGTMGAIQFTVTESRYRPTSGGVCGTYASLTTSVDRDKFSGAFISAGGAGTIWIISALANTEFVCFTYPVRFG